MNPSNTNCAIMQPYFLPYTGYFSLIKHTNQWVVFDDIRYSRKAWGNRNRIQKYPDGWSWINVPVKKHSRETNYSEIEIKNDIGWKDKILRQLEYYKKSAPYYKNVNTLVEDIFTPEFTRLVDLNIYAMVKVCDYLKIPFNHSKYSDLNLNIESVRHSGDWGLQICKSLGMEEYLNPYMGHSLFNKKEWDDENIKLKFLIDNANPDTDIDLSIINSMMWNTSDEINETIDKYIILAA